MLIKKYRLYLSEEERHPLLVEEDSFLCCENNFSDPLLVVENFNFFLKLNSLAEEFLYMIAFSSSMTPLGIFEISHGSVNQSVAGVREIFIRALLCGAVSILLLHNHPSGNIHPSKEDFLVAERIWKAGHLMGVELIDFIVVGDGYYSFAEAEIFKKI